LQAKNAFTLVKLAKKESWTGSKKQVAKGTKSWEDLACKEGVKMVPDAACTFDLIEVHLDGIKAAQHLLKQPATCLATSRSLANICRRTCA